MVAKCFGIVLTFVRHHRILVVISVSVNFDGFSMQLARLELVENQMLLCASELVLLLSLWLSLLLLVAAAAAAAVAGGDGGDGGGGGGGGDDDGDDDGALEENYVMAAVSPSEMKSSAAEH